MHDQIQLVAGHAGRGAIDEWIGKGQRQQKDHGQPEGEQQEVSQAPLLDGTLRAALKEHQRAEGTRRGAVTLQQMDIDGQSRRHRTGQKPGSQKAHQRLP